MPRNVILGLAADWGACAAATKPTGPYGIAAAATTVTVAAKANAKKLDRRFMISSPCSMRRDVGAASSGDADLGLARAFFRS